MRGVTCYTVCLLACLPLFATAQYQPHNELLGVNNVLLLAASNGMTSHNLNTDGPGLEFPNGSGKHVMRIEGLIWGAKVQGEIRLGGSTYRSGLQPGTIKAYGEASNPTDPRFHIYKVMDIRRSAFSQLPINVQQRLRDDFTNWPVNDGAPWVDTNNNGIYEPDFEDWLDGTLSADYPDVPGDAALWWVSNDLDSRKTNFLFGTEPIGLELQCTFWASNRPGAQENSVYLKYLFINKSDEILEDMYFAKWADADVGDGLDDLAGYSEVHQTGYCYNGSDYDDVYGDRPPAVGHVLLQGPLVPSPGEIGLMNGTLRAQHKNLPVHAFMVYDTTYLAGIDTNYPDDPLPLPYQYSYLQGNITPSVPLVNPRTLTPTTVMFSGDPIAKTGWIDGVYVPPGERKYLLSTGPFHMAPGDTQEVVFAVTIAQGTDRFNSIELLLQQSETLYADWNQMRPVSAPSVDALPTDIAIASVYPNPVSGKATITYSLPTIENVTLTLTNVLGQHVRKYDLGRKQTGRYNSEISTNDLPSGMYLLTLRSGKHFNTQRILVR